VPLGDDEFNNLTLKEEAFSKSYSEQSYTLNRSYRVHVNTGASLKKKRRNNLHYRLTARGVELHSVRHVRKTVRRVGNGYEKTEPNRPEF
jgi:hypothetical protein